MVVQDELHIQAAEDTANRARVRTVLLDDAAHVPALQSAEAADNACSLALVRVSLALVDITCEGTYSSAVTVNDNGVDDGIYEPAEEGLNGAVGGSDAHVLVDHDGHLHHGDVLSYERGLDRRVVLRSGQGAT